MVWEGPEKKEEDERRLEAVSSISVEKKGWFGKKISFKAFGTNVTMPAMLKLVDKHLGEKKDGLSTD